MGLVTFRICVCSIFLTQLNVTIGLDRLKIRFRMNELNLNKRII